MNKHKCLVDGCTSHPVSRGLCQNCYQAAWKLINGGKTSWAELEELGLALLARHDFRSRLAIAIEKRRRALAQKRQEREEAKAARDGLPPLPVYPNGEEKREAFKAKLDAARANSLDVSPIVCAAN